VTYDLQRFLDAQASVYQQVLAELEAGQKRTHWIWFIFPQIHGLGSSPTAQRFAIADLNEAIAYLGHPILGPRLRECTSLVNAVEGRSIGEIFGYPDDLKFHSSMTLFAEAAAKSVLADGIFRKALAIYFGGEPDQATLDRL